MRPALWVDDEMEFAEELGESQEDLPPEVLGRQFDGPQHRLFGHRDPVQSGNLSIRCEMDLAGIDEKEQAKLIRKSAIPQEIVDRAAHWRLLLQIDSDEQLGMEFGDGGRLYFMVREQDARAGDFSGAMMFSECG
jgi:hypothetical protein